MDGKVNTYGDLGWCGGSRCLRGGLSHAYQCDDHENLHAGNFDIASPNTPKWLFYVLNFLLQKVMKATIKEALALLLKSVALVVRLYYGRSIQWWVDCGGRGEGMLLPPLHKQAVLLVLLCCIGRLPAFRIHWHYYSYYNCGTIMPRRAHKEYRHYSQWWRPQCCCVAIVYSCLAAAATKTPAPPALRAQLAPRW